MHGIVASPTQLALTFKIALLLLLIAGLIIAFFFLRKKMATLSAKLFASLKVSKGERALLKLNTVSENEKVELSKANKIYEEGNVLLHDLLQRIMLGILRAVQFAMENKAFTILNIEKAKAGLELLVLAVGVWNSATVFGLAPMTFFPFGNLGQTIASKEAQDSGLADLLQVVLPKNQNDGGGNNNNGGKDNGGIAATFNRNLYSICTPGQRQKLAVAIVKYAIAKVSS